MGDLQLAGVLQVHWWPINKPIPYIRYSRTIPERAIGKVAASIRKSAWRQGVDKRRKSLSVFHSYF